VVGDVHVSSTDARQGMVNEMLPGTMLAVPDKLGICIGFRLVQMVLVVAERLGAAVLYIQVH